MGEHVNMLIVIACVMQLGAKRILSIGLQLNAYDLVDITVTNRGFISASKENGRN